VAAPAWALSVSQASGAVPAGHAVVKTGASRAYTRYRQRLTAAPLILLISYGYIKMLGGDGVTEATRIAILNANYIKESLKDHYPTLYSGKNGAVRTR